MDKKTNNVENQCQCLLKMLKEKPCTTFEIRHQLDIVAPAARVFELRHEQGHNIRTVWDSGQNPGGGRHRIARYFLMPGKWRGEAAND